MAEETKDEAERILEGLSQEERLKLLERLIQGASQAKEETLTVEERLERVENIVLGSGAKKHVYVHRMHGDRRAVSGACLCCG